MHDGDDFHRAMAALLQQLGIPPPQQTVDECYEVCFNDGSRVYFANIEPGMIDAVTEAGELPGRADKAADLLALNQPEPGRHLLVVGVDRSSRKIHVRARIGMMQAHGEVLRDLAWQMVERVAAVRTCLGETVREHKAAPSAVRSQQITSTAKTLLSK